MAQFDSMDGDEIRVYCSNKGNWAYTETFAAPQAWFEQYNPQAFVQSQRFESWDACNAHVVFPCKSHYSQKHRDLFTFGCH